MRYKHYKNELIASSVDLITQKLNANVNAEELKRLAMHFEADIKLIELASYKPKYQHQYNIDNYRLILEKKEGSYQLIKRISNERLLQIRWFEISTHQIWLALSYLSQELSNSSQAEDEFIQQVQKLLPYNIEVIDSPKNLDTALFKRLMRNSEQVHEYQKNKKSYFLLSLNQSKRVLKVGPVAEFNALPWSLVLPIFFNAIAFLGLFIYWRLCLLESQIKQFEQATNRLARGYLSARVVLPQTSSISSLGLGFNKMAGYIERLIEIQREMVRAISHELRTPVARVRFGLEMIEDVAQSDAFVSKQLKGIDGDIRELDELIDEILTYARLEDGAPMVDFRLSNLAKQALQVVSDSRPPEGVTVSYSGLDEKQKIKAEIEARHIHRAIQNLVGNACRYAQSKVLVSCEIANGICRVDVEDDGAGIPEEDRERVFTPFARLDDSRTRSSGGYGLGLSIVQRIAYWHGGRVTLKQSDQLGGAHFSIIWPQYQD